MSNPVFWEKTISKYRLLIILPHMLSVKDQGCIQLNYSQTITKFLFICDRFWRTEATIRELQCILFWKKQNSDVCKQNFYMLVGNKKKKKKKKKSRNVCRVDILHSTP